MDVCMSMADGHEPRSNACAGLSVEDCEALDRVAAEMLDARGIIMMITDAVGRVIGSAADYGTFGRWLLLILTVICWAAQFASMSLTCAPCFSPCSNVHSHHDSS